MLLKVKRFNNTQNIVIIIQLGRIIKSHENQNIERQQQNDESIEVDFCCGVLGCLIL